PRRPQCRGPEAPRFLARTDPRSPRRVSFAVRRGRHVPRACRRLRRSLFRQSARYGNRRFHSRRLRAQSLHAARLMSGWRKLGVIAGGGELPVVLAEHLAATQRPYFIARITPMADSALEAHPGAGHGLGQMGARMDAIREAGCDAVVLIGNVERPDLNTLQLDDVAMSM